MSSEGKDKSNTNGQKDATVSMTGQSAKRQKTDKKNNSSVAVVELDMTKDEVPLETSQLTHTFMADISTLEDTQITECVPKTLKLLGKFHQTKRSSTCCSLHRETRRNAGPHYW